MQILNRFFFNFVRGYAKFKFLRQDVRIESSISEQPILCLTWALFFFTKFFHCPFLFFVQGFSFLFTMLTGRAIEKRSPGKQISTKMDCLGLTLASWKRQKCGWFGTMLEILFTNSRRSGTFWDQGREQDFCLGEVNFLLHLDIA